MISINVMNRILVLLHYLEGEKRRYIIDDFLKLERRLVMVELPSTGIDLIAAFYAAHIHLNECYHEMDISERRNHMIYIVYDILGFETICMDNAPSYISLENINKINNYMTLYDTILVYKKVFNDLLNIIASQDLNAIFDQDDEGIMKFLKGGSMFSKVITILNNLRYMNIIHIPFPSESLI